MLCTDAKESEVREASQPEEHDEKGELRNEEEKNEEKQVDE